MSQNDILRRMRYILDLDDSKMMSIFELGGAEVTRAQAKPEPRLTNNMVFMKLKIASNLKAEDSLAILALSKFKINKHELSAFFRKPEHKHYRKCQHQVLRNFLKGLQIKYRGNTGGPRIQQLNVSGPLMPGPLMP